MVDFGLRPRKVEVDMVLANEACENSPWKLTRKVGYAGRYNGALTDPNAPKQPAAETPAPQTPDDSSCRSGGGNTATPTSPQAGHPQGGQAPEGAPAPSTLRRTHLGHAD